MMKKMYCEACKHLSDGNVCSCCGGDTRPARNSDDCFVAECSMLIGEMLADIYRQEEIPHYFKTLFGAGMTMRIGPYMDVYTFYVPCAFWEQADEIAREICPQNAE